MDKAEFRRECLQTLRKTAAKNSRAMDAKINEKLYRLAKRTKAKKILFYLPLKMEADITKCLARLRREKVQIFVPFIGDINFKMVSYRLPLKTGRLGVKTSSASFQNIKNIDIALVPVVGVDADFRRVGFGKGMYDRFFASLIMMPLIVFVQRIACLSSQKLTFPYDTKGDLLVSANKIITQGNTQNDSRNNNLSSAATVRRCGLRGSKKDRPSQISHLCRAVKIQSKSHRT